MEVVVIQTGEEKETFGPSNREVGIFFFFSFHEWKEERGFFHKGGGGGRERPVMMLSLFRPKLHQPTKEEKEEEMPFALDSKNRA